MAVTYHRRNRTIARLGLCAALGLIGGGILAIPFSGHDSPKVIAPITFDSTSTAPATGAIGVPPTVATSVPADPETDPTAPGTTSTAPGSTAPGSTTTATDAAAPTTTQDTASVTTVSPVPSVDATAYVVIDETSGVQLAASNTTAALPVGSIQKLLTAYVVMQAGDPAKIVTVPKLTLVDDESNIGLRTGDKYSREILLRALLIVSAGDAASALAIDIAGSEEAFVAKMNEAAHTLGLTDTVAMNPTGLDVAGQHSTVADVVTLAKVLMQDPTFAATVARRSATLHGVVLPNTNKLLGSFTGTDGIKTGHTTQAGYCIVASANRDGREILVVVLGATTDAARTAAASALLTWGFGQPAGG